LEDQGIGGRMGSEWILERLAWGGGCRLESTGSGQGPVAGCCDCSQAIIFNYEDLMGYSKVSLGQRAMEKRWLDGS
jgi:hypothetical protein